MSVSLRLTRIGKKKQPHYRIVAVDKRKARDGKYIEKLGIFNPLKTSDNLVVNKDLVFKWFRVGAQPTQTVKQIFSKQGLLKEWVELNRTSATDSTKKKKIRKSRHRPMKEKLKLRLELEKKQVQTDQYTAKKRKEQLAKEKEASEKKANEQQTNEQQAKQPEKTSDETSKPTETTTPAAEIESKEKPAPSTPNPTSASPEAKP
ncbi:30S ribosomal protein S16 [Spirochaetota bacterium]|nr:30S ribosomal protein S16 [Spirochaetota bacterium]